METGTWAYYGLQRLANNSTIFVAPQGLNNGWASAGGEDVTFVDDMLRHIEFVIRNAGPKGYPGMPEVSNFPLPAKVLKAGVKDMVRVCDGRMSGTGYGTVVLHVAPEAAVGGPLALVHDGDPVVLDLPNRSLRLDVDDAELTRRRQTWKAPAERHTSGYAWLNTQNVEQADQGADFGFLRGSRGHEVPCDSH